MDIDLVGITNAAEIALRLGIAAGYGMVLGIDREVRGKAAGLRTHMLVALGAAATTLVTIALFTSLHNADMTVGANPIRVISGVMSAIGFLGAGAIIKDGNHSRGVRGLTSAANLWLCEAIGIAAGAGEYLIAAITFAYTVMILVLVRLIEVRVIRRDQEE